MIQPETESQLIDSARRGSRAAFEEIIRRTGRLVYAHLFARTRDVHRAEDLVQETFLSAWKSIGTLEDTAKLRSWLLSIATRLSLDVVKHELRKKRVHKITRIEELGTVMSAEPGPLEETQRQEEQSRAIEALNELPEEYRTVLMLRYLSGADRDEIGRQLALSNGSLRGMLQRGMKLLREKLTQS